MTRKYFEAIGKDSLVRMTLILQEENDIYKKIIVELAERTCDGCKLQYDKWCPVAELNHELKYCDKWEAKDVKDCSKKVESAIKQIGNVMGGVAEALRDEDAKQKTTDIQQ